MSEPHPDSEFQEHLPPVLRDIILHKRREVEHRRSVASLETVKAAALASDQPRNLFDAVTHRQFVSDIAIIAEIKRMSPSAGLIRPEYAGDDFSPEDIAQKYERAGARAISCLTDERFFGGHLSFLKRVKIAVKLPVLRKDFLIDPWQLYESRSSSAGWRSSIRLRSTLASPFSCRSRPVSTRRRRLEKFDAAVTAFPEVVECYRMSGDVDYLLRVAVPDIAAYDVFYAGWDRSNTAPSSGSMIHHPLNDVKKINLFSLPGTSVVHSSGIPCWSVNWANGVAEGGSSVAGLFNSAKRVVCTAYDGEQTCATSTTAPSFFAKLLCK